MQQYIKGSNVLRLHLIYQFVSWCLRLPYAKKEDTRPIVFQNGFDVSVLKTRYFRKKYLITDYIVSKKNIFSKTGL